MHKWSVLFLSLACACTHSRVILETPASRACDEAKLRSCEMLANGVIEYANGDVEAARIKFRLVARENPPEALRPFADAMRTLAKAQTFEGYAEALTSMATELERASSQDAAAKSHPVTMEYWQ